VVVEEHPLDAVNDAITDVLAGLVDARVVLRP